MSLMKFIDRNSAATPQEVLCALRAAAATAQASQMCRLQTEWALCHNGAVGRMGGISRTSGKVKLFLSDRNLQFFRR